MKHFDRSTRFIQCRVGELFVVELPAVMTAGYQWAARTTAGDAVALESAELGAPRAALGGTTIQAFRFRAQGRGRAVLMFSYGRPWEEAAQEQIEVEVVVD